MNASSLKKILPFAVVVFFAYVGFSLPLPLLPELFLDPEVSILPPAWSIQTKIQFLGLVIASFPIGQFIGSPLLGKWSDRLGRKKVITFSLIGTTLGYAITGLAVEFHHLWGIFLGLALCGFCEGNIGIAQAAIADLGEGSSRTAHFGILNTFVSLGFVVGPFMGGQLVNARLVSWFSFSTPFYAAGLMTIFGLIYISFATKETSPQTHEKQVSHSIRGLLQIPVLRSLYLADFILWVGIFFYFRFLPVFLERIFDFDAIMQSYVMTYEALIMGSASIFLIKPLAHRMSSLKLTSWGAFLVSVSMVVLLIPNSPSGLWWTIPPLSILLAIVMTNSSALVSHAAPANAQGTAMGTLQALQVLAEIITAIAGGFLAGLIPSMPLIVGSVFLVLGGILLIYRFRKEAI